MTEYSVNEGRSPRFTSWVFFLMCSVITLKASVEVRNDMSEANSASKYAVVCSAITFAVTALVALLHMSPISSIFFIGTLVEGLIIFVLVGFSTALVSIVTNTGNDLGTVKASSNSSEILNGNLYYFSWFGFVTSVLLMVSYLKSSCGVDLVAEVNGRGARLMYWGGLLTTSLVVVGSSARTLNEDCSGDSEVKFPVSYCTRTKLGVALGSIGVAFSVAVVGIKLVRASPPFTVEFMLATLLTVVNAFGVAYITSNSGPGRAIGNLYYSTWCSFLLSVFLAVECFNSSKSSGPATTAEEDYPGAKAEEGEVDIPVESLDEEEEA